MSVFMHDDQAFDSIARSLISMTNANDHRINYLMDVIMTTLVGYLPPAEVESYERDKWRIARFCEALHKANTDSVNYLYKHRGSKLKSDYKCAPHRGQQLAPIALVKLLDSVEYQSCEPIDWHSEPIAKELGKIIQALQAHIVRGLPEYEAARWSI
jgi:hypothetical protein